MSLKFIVDYSTWQTETYKLHYSYDI